MWCWSEGKMFAQVLGEETLDRAEKSSGMRENSGAA